MRKMIGLASLGLAAVVLIAAAPAFKIDNKAQPAAEPGYGNVQTAVRSLGDIGKPNSVDRVFTAQNYHDLKSKNLLADTAMGVNQTVFAAL